MRVTGVSCLKLFETDGAEQEDSVQQQEADSQPAVQPPVVHMDTEDLRSYGQKEAHGEKLNKCFLFCCVITKYVSKKMVSDSDGWSVCFCTQSHYLICAL